MTHLPTELRMAVGDEDARFLAVHPTINNGDCLFDSIRIVLNRSANLNISCAYIRSVVARSLLEKNNSNVSNTLHYWYSLYHDLRKEGSPELYEYAFMSPVWKQPWPLDASIIQAISDRMTVPSLYWGEQYALYIIEQQLQIRFIIFNIIPTTGIRIHSSLDHTPDKDTYKPTHYIFLLLQSHHYQPLSFENHYIFSPNNLPPKLQTLIKISVQNNGWIIKMI